MKSTSSSKGQLTVPIEGSPAEHPIDRLFGRIELRKPVDELLDEIRGPRLAPPARKSRTKRR